MKILILATCVLFAFPITAQEDAEEKLPYHQIPDYPESYNANTVAARILDGLGYRYYWATEGLRDEDLNYKPSSEARTILETLDHIRGLTHTSLLTIQQKPIISGVERDMSFEIIRKETLQNIKTASDILKINETGVEDMKIVFQRGEKSSEFPFWNLLNGPIADALWHTGQVVSHRRSSGNPLYPGVSVFRGVTRE